MFAIVQVSFFMAVSGPGSSEATLRNVLHTTVGSTIKPLFIAVTAWFGLKLTAKV